MPKKPESAVQSQLYEDLVALREQYQRTCAILVTRALAVGVAPAAVRSVVRRSILQGIDPGDLERAKTALEMADSIAGHGKEPPS